MTKIKIIPRKKELDLKLTEEEKEKIYGELIRNKDFRLYCMTNNIKDITLIAVGSIDDQLGHLHSYQRTRDVCLKAIKRDKNNLKYVSSDVMDYEFCLEAVKAGCRLDKILEKINKPFNDPIFYLEAVKSNGMAICHVPQKFLTEELYMAAVENNGEALSQVPKEGRSREMCIEALKSNGKAIKYIPKEYLTQEMCMKAVFNGETLRNIPNRFRNYKVCLEAVKNTDDSFHSVPVHNKTKELCHEAVKNTPIYLGQIPPEFITEELCNEAVRKNGLLLKDVPDKYKTYSMCSLAVNNNPWAYSYVPEEFRDYVIVYDTITSGGGLLREIKNVPKDFLDEEMYKALVKLNPSILKFVPKSLMTVGVIESALMEYGHAIRDIPEEYHTESVCEMSIKSKYPYLPKYYSTPELCMKALKINHLVFGEISNALKTTKVIASAVNLTELNQNVSLLYKINAMKTEELFELFNLIEEPRKIVPYIKWTKKLIKMLEKDGWTLKNVEYVL